VPPLEGGRPRPPLCYNGKSGIGPASARPMGSMTSWARMPMPRRLAGTGYSTRRRVGLLAPLFGERPGAWRKGHGRLPVGPSPFRWRGTPVRPSRSDNTGGTPVPPGKTKMDRSWISSCTASFRLGRKSFKTGADAGGRRRRGRRRILGAVPPLCPLRDSAHLNMPVNNVLRLHI
jgi:hypothetical protein